MSVRITFQGNHLKKNIVTETIDFNKHDINIFINYTWRKYSDDMGRLCKFTRPLELRF